MSQSFLYTFRYANQSDALENGLIRRLDNPDTNAFSRFYTALSLSDQAALTYHFCLANPEASSSNIETFLKQSLIGDATGIFSSGTNSINVVPSTPYTPDKAFKWYEQNFDWDQAGASTLAPNNLHLPLRSMLVTRNPVSNMVPALTNPIAPDGSVSDIAPLSPLAPLADRAPAGMAAYNVSPAITESSRLSKAQRPEPCSWSRALERTSTKHRSLNSGAPIGV